MSPSNPPERPRGAATVVLHADRAHNSTRALTPPIFQTSTFRWDDIDAGRALAATEAPAEFYARWGHPNARQVEAIVAELEGAHGAIAVASGMAAAAASVMPFVRAGDHVVAAKTLYGEAATLLTTVLPRFGVECTQVDGTDVSRFVQALRPTTRVVLVETPANPTLDCIDIAGVADAARRHGARLVVDNTFATPLNTQPLALGAHTSFHSATKYLSGHSDVTAGVVASDREGVSGAWESLRVLGAVLGPFDAWLVTRGLRTLPMRMERHNANGMRVAEFLAGHADVAHVNHPGLTTHRAHVVARKQMRGFGAMLSLELRGGEPAARKFVAALRLFTAATSLGGVESLVQFPATLTRMTAEQQQAAGISPSLVRLSVGCEDADDLLTDLRYALAAVA